MSDELVSPDGESARLPHRDRVLAYLKDHQHEIEDFLSVDVIFASCARMEHFVDQLWEEEVAELGAAMTQPGVVETANVIGRIRSCLPDYFREADFSEELGNTDQYAYAAMARKAAAWDWLKRQTT